MSRTDNQRRIDRLLSEPGGTLGALVGHARRLEALADGVAALLDPDLAEHCRVTDFRGGELILACDSAARATQLRYHSKPVQERMIAAGIPVTALKVVVRPPARPVVEPERRRRRPTLSAEASRTLESGAAGISHEPLADALRRLAAQAVTGDK